jgi:hypothetical protein
MPSSATNYRRRGRRGSQIDAPHGFFGLLWERVSRADVLVRLGVCLAAALVLLVVVGGWAEPFPFRTGMVPPRGIVARVPFEKPDPVRTRTAQDRAAALVPVVYAQDKAPLVRLRDGLKTRVAEIAAADTLATVSRKAWLEFAPDAGPAFDALLPRPRRRRNRPSRPSPPKTRPRPPTPRLMRRSVAKTRPPPPAAS